jgi:hypothetical protein
MKIKKYLPIALLLLGIFVVVGAALVIRSRTSQEDEGQIVDVEPHLRPVVSLTPSEDGHWLTLRIEKIVIEAATLDYELLYNLPDGRIQGVPGTVALEGNGVIEKELLLGTESSGNFYFDEGVEKGTVTLSFRDERGKLTAKMISEFMIFSKTDRFVSSDEKFEFITEDVLDSYIVVMPTLGYFGEMEFNLVHGPYGVFSATETDVVGNVVMEGREVLTWSGEDWQVLNDQNLRLPLYFASN